MLDLFSGSGAASRAAAVRGWDVLRVDNGEGTAADVRADLETWNPDPDDLRCFDLVWASPPCTELSTANLSGRDVERGLRLVRASLRLIAAARPRWWVLENVHGATRAIGSLIGPPVATYGSFYLWGVFPPFEASVARGKTKMSGRRRAERRAAIPWAISDGLVRACETLARELPFSGDLGGLVGAGGELERGELGDTSGASRSTSSGANGSAISSLPTMLRAR
jgi:C-5 cytosine-specific DNA methylase